MSNVYIIAYIDDKGECAGCIDIDESFILDIEESMESRRQSFPYSITMEW